MQNKEHRRKVLSFYLKNLIEYNKLNDVEQYKIQRKRNIIMRNKFRRFIRNFYREDYSNKSKDKYFFINNTAWYEEYIRIHFPIDFRVKTLIDDIMTVINMNYEYNISYNHDNYDSNILTIKMKEW